MDKKEFEFRKKLIDYEKEMRIEVINHELSCKLQFNEDIRETDRLKHEKVLEAQRIKTAEIKKLHERKRLQRQFEEMKPDGTNK